MVQPMGKPSCLQAVKTREETTKYCNVREGLYTKVDQNRHKCIYIYYQECILYKAFG